jgi:hypothetical protein
VPVALGCGEPRRTYTVARNDGELEDVDVLRFPNEKFIYSIAYRDTFQGSIDIEYRLAQNLTYSGPKVRNLAFVTTFNTAYADETDKKRPRLSLVCPIVIHSGIVAKRRERSPNFRRTMTCLVI